MRISEHAFLRDLQHSKVKAKKSGEIAEICLSCRGKCKAAKRLVRCPGKERWNK